MQNIFIKIKNSIYSPEYYKEVLRKPFSYSFKYYIVFALIISLFTAVVATVVFTPVERYLKEQSYSLADRFPENLTINIKDGKASSSVEEPYFVKMPEDFYDSNEIKTSPDLEKMENLLVINTKDKLDIEKFKSYNTVVLLTGDSLVYLDKDNKISISSLSSVKEFTLNKSVTSDFLSKVRPFLKFVYPFAFLAGWLFKLILSLATLLYLFAGALLIWLVCKLRGIKISYMKSYQLGLHLLTFPIIATTILNTINSAFSFPFSFTILLLIFAVINIRKVEPKVAL